MPASNARISHDLTGQCFDQEVFKVEPLTDAPECPFADSQSFSLSVDGSRSIKSNRELLFKSSVTRNFADKTFRLWVRIPG